MSKERKIINEEEHKRIEEEMERKMAIGWGKAKFGGLIGKKIINK